MIYEFIIKNPTQNYNKIIFIVEKWVQKFKYKSEYIKMFLKIVKIYQYDQNAQKEFLQILQTNKTLLFTIYKHLDFK